MESVNLADSQWIDNLALNPPAADYATWLIAVAIVISAVVLFAIFYIRRPYVIARFKLFQLNRKSRISGLNRNDLYHLCEIYRHSTMVNNLRRITASPEFCNKWDEYVSTLSRLAYQPAEPDPDEIKILIHNAHYWFRHLKRMSC